MLKQLTNSEVNMQTNLPCSTSLLSNKFGLTKTKTFRITIRCVVRGWHSVINHCDRRITLLSDTDISFGLFNLFTFFDLYAFWVIISNNLNVNESWKIYPNHQDK